MARAKRTDRAEARRRYRAQLVEDAEPLDAEPATPSEPIRRTAPPSTGPRRGMASAFREAFQPLDLRGDIAALPQLLRSRAGWLPILLVIVAVVVAAVVGTANVLGNLAFYWFISPFPMAPAFVIGFLAPRASYLLGIPVGLLGGSGTALILALTPGGATSPDAQAYIVYTFLMAPPFTAFFAAAAAWYKRFLALINPNRTRRAGLARSGGKTTSRRSAVARR